MKLGHLVIALCAAFGVHAASAQEPVRIGAVYALTGPIAPYGVPQQKALQLRTEEIKRAAGSRAARSRSSTTTPRAMATRPCSWCARRSSPTRWT